jgi:hypothetical protein
MISKKMRRSKSCKISLSGLSAPAATKSKQGNRKLLKVGERRMSAKIQNRSGKTGGYPTNSVALGLIEDELYVYASHEKSKDG